MNENVDKEREKRSFLCRQTIKQTLSNPVRPAVRSKRSLAREIAFAKEIILPGRAHPRAAVRIKAKREVRSTNVLDGVTSASNTQAKTKYMNHKDYQNWKVGYRKHIYIYIKRCSTVHFQIHKTKLGMSNRARGLVAVGWRNGYFKCTGLQIELFGFLFLGEGGGGGGNVHCDVQVSHPGRSRNTPSHFMLQKLG